MKPKEVDKNTHIAAFANKNIILPRKRPKFKEDDKVRISKYKHIFKKVYTQNWTTEIFTINKVLPTTHYTYTSSRITKINLFLRFL